MAVPTVIHGTNGKLLAAVAQLWIRPGDRVLDATYGRGRFWTVYRPPNLVAHDARLDGVDFRHLPEPDGSFDVAVLDPPYTSTGNRATSGLGDDWWDRYGIGAVKGWQALFEMNEAGMKECARVLAPGGRLLVKTADYVESGKRRWGHRHVVDTCTGLGLEQLDEFILVRAHPGPQPPGRGEEHARQAHSFLCVFGL
jgi:hypothetical protein